MLRRVWIGLLIVASPVFAWGADAGAPTDPEKRVPIDPAVVEILEIGCFSCHADGEAEGGFDIQELLAQPIDPKSAGPATRETWHRVLKNVRSQIMPPSDAEQLTSEERRTLTRFIARQALGVNPDDVDPGHVTLRRLNRIEYRNTIRDLVGVDFEAEAEFPVDDSGHGFDNIGDVLSLSPLLMEKYLAAAETIVSQAVPIVPWMPKRRSVSRSEMTHAFLDEKWIDPEEQADEDEPRDAEEDEYADRKKARFDGEISFYRKQTVVAELTVDTPGRFRIEPVLDIRRGFDFDPGRAVLTFTLNDKVLHTEEFGWGSKLRGRDEDLEFDISAELIPGKNRLVIEIEPLLEQSRQETELSFQLDEVNVVGPLDHDHWVRPRNWQRFFETELPDDAGDRRRAARVIENFARRAFRRDADPDFVRRLLDLIEPDLADPEATFERAVAKAFVVVLSSPRFVFRQEFPVTDSGPDELSPTRKSVSIDEFSLSSRLSYFLWSTMPDDQLLSLAGRGELRQQLTEQVDRMLADPRSEQFVSNFVGQWLKTRDIESIPIDVLGAAGLRPEYEELRDRLREVFDERREIARNSDSDPEVAEAKSREYREYETRLLLDRIREIRETRDLLDGRTRRDLRRQTEALFRYVLDEDRNVLELIDNDYEFLNERLAKYYELDWDTLNPNPDRDRRRGDELRRVRLDSSRRGGVLRQANFLIVTSNPTRTSPVKRGLFILDNILGTPAPPAPAAVPELEEAAEAISDHEPTLRELLQRHRSDPLCASCHRRFDPMGLSLENYDAMGRWRDEQFDQPIDPQGELISGETFDDAAELMHVLTGPRRFDFYRCLTEKIMTYALGRGIDYQDEPTIDALVQSLESDGQTPTLRRIIHSVVRTPAMQKMRNPE